ncbi:DUF4886 domain-containing protein [Dysgonomonas massiliensis]|uniref:DUF4886 domain-containing protein n=1 Tax=Dysgonomonas massiliensis TaxID=2040292 RepID=UPI000C78302E|nr:DUF4886 domain-containing protein [Dysgonomonas massiliensis]
MAGIENIDFQELSGLPITENKADMFVVGYKNTSGNPTMVTPIGNLATKAEVESAVASRATTDQLNTATQQINLSLVGLSNQVGTKAEQSEVNELKDRIGNGGTPIERYKDAVDTIAILEALPVEQNEKGDGRVVTADIDANGQSYTWVWDGSNWGRTPYTTLPADVAIKGGSYLNMKQMDDKKSDRIATYGGNYINKYGVISHLNLSSSRGYSKPILLVDGLVINNYSVLTANKISDTEYASVFLYDSRFRCIGFLTDSQSIENASRTINISEIQSIFPSALYFRVNASLTSDFSITTLDNNIPLTADDSFINQELNKNNLYNLVVAGGSYINKSGVVTQSLANYRRGFTRFIYITDGLKLEHFAVVSANLITSGTYASVMLFDSKFEFVGNLTHTTTSEDISITLNKASITDLFPTAVYCAVNLNVDNGFQAIATDNTYPFSPTDEYVEVVRRKKALLQAVVLGGGYVGMTGQIVLSTFNMNRGYTKYITIVDGLQLKHFAVLSSNSPSANLYASVFLYDKYFNYVGYLSQSSRGEDFSITLNKAEITAVYPTAVYFRTNINSENGFDVVMPSGSIPPVVDEGYVSEMKSIYSMSSRQIINPSLPKLNIDDEIKILAIGSSWLNDTVIRLRDVAIASGLRVEVGNALSSGLSYQTIVDKFNNSELVDYTLWDSLGNPAVTSQNTISNIILSKSWDIVVIQQGAKDGFFLDSFQPYMSKWIHILKTNLINPNAVITMNHTWTPDRNGQYISSYGFTSQQAMWDATLHNITIASYQSGIDLVVPCGMAIYSLRTTSLQNDNDLTRDKLHLDSGIGTYTAACTFFEAILKPIYGVSILGNTYRSPDQTPTDKYTPVTDANAIIAQKCAISANANRFGYVDFSGLL